MLLNESSYDFALCFICYLSIALDLFYVLFLDLFVFYSTFVLCFLFGFTFASKSCLWPLFLFQLSFCKSRFSSLALVFGSCLTFVSYFCFSFFVYGFYLAFASCFCLTSCFWLLSNSHFSLLFFIFHLWVKAHYSGPKVIDVVFIISHFHNVKLESLF